jgi:hypothetical protein
MFAFLGGLDQRDLQRTLSAVKGDRTIAHPHSHNGSKQE